MSATGGQCGKRCSAAIDFDHGRSLHGDQVYQGIFRIVGIGPVGAGDGGLHLVAAHGHSPLFVQEEVGTAKSGVPGEVIVSGEGIAQRHTQRPPDAGEVAEAGVDTGAPAVARAEEIRSLAGPGAARFRIHLGLLPGHPAILAGVEQPWRDAGQHHQAGGPGPEAGWHEAHQRRAPQRQQWQQHHAVAAVVPGVRPQRGDIDGRARGVQAPHVEGSGQGQQEHGPEGAPHQRRRRARHTHPEQRRSGTQRRRRTVVQKRLGPVMEAGVRPPALYGDGGIRAAVEPERVTEVVPVMSQPPERPQSGEGPEDQQGAQAFFDAEKQANGHKRQQKPALIAGECTRQRAEARTDGPAAQAAIEHARERRQEERLGHGNGLQVKQVGIEREDRDSGQCRHLTEQAAHRGKQKRPGKHETGCRGDAARQSRLPQPLVAHQREHEHVQQREPYAADLLPAGCA